MTRILAAVLTAGVLSLSGCGGGSSSGAGAETDSAEAADGTARLAGRYHLVISQNAGSEGHVDIYAARIRFPKSDGDEAAGGGEPNGDGERAGIELEHATQAFPSPKLVDSSIEDGVVRLAFESEGDRVNFEGRITSDGAWGSFCIGGLQCTPARLIPEQGSRFSDEDMVSRSTGSSELMKLRESGGDFEDLLGFCRRNPKSPAVVDVYAELMPYLGAMDYSEQQVRDYAQAYVKAASRWGERMGHVARANVGMGLAITEHLPELGLEYLREAEQHLSPTEAEAVRRLIGQAEEIISRGKARELIASGEVERALAILEPLKAKRALDPSVTYLLARAAEKSGDTDRALALYGELVALPQFETMLVNSPGWKADDEQPGAALERLWEQARGGSDGLDEFLNKVYVEAVSQVAHSADAPPAVDTGSRITLAELFTGATCPPCVAADVAGMALEATYPRSDLIVLRYHQHIPGPDPLTNADGERRFLDYRLQSTPSFIINGRPVDQNVGGPLVLMAPGVYSVLRQEVDPPLSEDSEYTIEISAAEQDEKLTLRASLASGDTTDDLRLRLVLAEDDLSFKAQNGVRQHRLIVRQMPGGPAGIAPAEGKLEFEGTISREELRESLREYLTEFEQERGVRFPVKPLELKPLYFVAFIQNERTKEILQAAGVPVGNGAADGDSTTPDAAADGDAAADPAAADAQRPADGNAPPPTDGSAAEDAPAADDAVPDAPAEAETPSDRP